jgi:hypothetical protein
LVKGSTAIDSRGAHGVGEFAAGIGSGIPQVVPAAATGGLQIDVPKMLAVVNALALISSVWIAR